ncbi:hypothetical protein WJ978_19910 [Achromobacter xylosoxidans]
MADQWLRKASLVLENAAGDQLDISQLHFKFSISAADVQTPAAAQIRVYNLSDNTAQRIQKEFAKVTLRAGYEGNFGTIFVGDVKQIRRGKETSIDKYLDITAANGDMAYNFAVANFTLAAGWTATELYNALLQELSVWHHGRLCPAAARHRISEGHVVLWNGSGPPEGIGGDGWVFLVDPR